MPVLGIGILCGIGPLSMSRVVGERGLVRGLGRLLGCVGGLVPR